MDPRIYRMIDANANRVREALRVLEDVARFALNDGALCQDLKSARHEVVGLMQGMSADTGALLASRDTPSDVGTKATTAAESRRNSIGAVTDAAVGRATEALRVIEECAKAIDAANTAERVEGLRYRVYELGKRVRLSLGTCRGVQWRLCVLMTESLCTHHSWEQVVQQAIDGGADCIQLREKVLPDSEILRRARRLVAIGRERNVSVTVNDRADIALLAGADGVHVGQADIAVADIRRVAGFRLLVGVSTETISQARAACRDGADYCGVGPIFSTTTKSKERTVGPRALAAYLDDPVTAERPHLAIGGIHPENVGSLVGVGCRGVAVSSCVCQAQQPAAICRGLLRDHDMSAGE